MENSILKNPLIKKEINQQNLSIKDFLKIIDKYFHSSHYQKKKITNLLDLVVVNEKLVWKKEELIKMIKIFIPKYPISLQEKKADKKKLNLFLDFIDEQINPYKKKIKKEIKEITKNLTKKKINFQMDENYQNDQFTFSFKANNSRDYHQKILALNNFDIEKIYKIFNGNEKNKF